MSRTILSFACLFPLLASTATAQEIRIYTRVYDTSPSSADSAGKQRIIARSLALFHGGKVDDYIDTVGGVTIFEPAERRFTILNESRMLVTTVSFDEIRNLLKIADNETANYIAELQDSGDSKSVQAAEALQFQRNPRFQVDYRADEMLLLLESPTLSYRVKCAQPPSPEVVAPCIRYADWMARLNFVLHPGAFLPEARTMVDQELLNRGLIPIEVERRTEFDPPIQLLAQHRIHWNLDSRDRSSIHHWKTLLASDEITKLTFPEYQRTVAGQPTAGKR